jgi:hypothetical protein
MGGCLYVNRCKYDPGTSTCEEEKLNKLWDSRGSGIEERAGGEEKVERWKFDRQSTHIQWCERSLVPIPDTSSEWRQLKGYQCRWRCSARGLRFAGKVALCPNQQANAVLSDVKSELDDLQKTQDYMNYSSLMISVLENRKLRRNRDCGLPVRRFL